MKVKEPHESYLRLFEAASLLPTPLHLPSEVARFLTLNGLKVSDQMMTNWKSRGVSRDKAVDVARIIGIRPDWLIYGEGAKFTQGGLVSIGQADRKILETSEDIQQAAIKLLTTMDIDDAHVWLEKTRAEANKARRSNQEKRDQELTTCDPTHESGHATSHSSPRRRA